MDGMQRASMVLPEPGGADRGVNDEARGGYHSRPFSALLPGNIRKIRQCFSQVRPSFPYWLPIA